MDEAIISELPLIATPWADFFFVTIQLSRSFVDYFRLHVGKYLGKRNCDIPCSMCFQSKEDGDTSSSASFIDTLSTAHIAAAIAFAPHPRQDELYFAFASACLFAQGSFVP